MGKMVWYTVKKNNEITVEKLDDKPMLYSVVKSLPRYKRMMNGFVIGFHDNEIQDAVSKALKDIPDGVYYVCFEREVITTGMNGGVHNWGVYCFNSKPSASGKRTEVIEIVATPTESGWWEDKESSIEVEDSDTEFWNHIFMDGKSHCRYKLPL